MKALVLADIQNDFVPGGALAIPEGDKIVPLVNQLQRTFDLVVATQDWHPANHGSFAASHTAKKPGEVIQLNGLPQVLWPVHCVQNTSGAELVPTLERNHITRIFQKGIDPEIDSYSGFFDNGHRRSTGMGEFLKEKGVNEIFLAGLATDYCVKFTALDAVSLGFKTHLFEQACRGVNLQPGDSAAAVQEMLKAGVQLAAVPEVLATGKYLSLIREGHWEYAARTQATGAAVIVAVTEEKKLLLVEQYRIPCHASVVEFPAGIIGDLPDAGNESHAEAAKRELLEETGYQAGEIEQLTAGPVSSGLTSEITTFFHARKLRRTGAGGGVAHEKITVHEVPLPQVEEWLHARERSGVMVDPKVYAGLYFLNQSRLASASGS